VLAEKMAFGVGTAVQCWTMAVEAALTDAPLTALGRLNAVDEFVQNYKLLAGKVQFD
jgi:hypothetical protein